ncbi:hypothetical protein LEN26_017342 [Aphanomyces euteiches]|nr:hypothetical protein LEN26_017342 [Aphanomyces euteiches]
MSKKKAKAIPIETKLDAITFAKQFGVRPAAKKYGVYPACIRDWRSKEAELKNSNRHRKRLPGAGRSLTSTQLDEILFERIIYDRCQHLRVTRAMIVSWGRELASDMAIPSKCSNGWLEKFLGCHDFVVRKGTRKPSLPPEEIIRRAYTEY